MMECNGCQFVENESISLTKSVEVYYNRSHRMAGKHGTCSNDPYAPPP